jgi:hypothetical protein
MFFFVEIAGKAVSRPCLPSLGWPLDAARFPLLLSQAKRLTMRIEETAWRGDTLPLT